MRRSVKPTLAISSPIPARVGLAPGDLERQEDVLLRGEHRQQVEELEDEADVVAAQRGQPGVIEAGDLDVADPHLPLVGLVEPGQDVHERGLARARRAHDGRQPLRPHVEIYAAQGVDRGVSLAVVAGDIERSYRHLRLGGDVEWFRQSESCHGGLLVRGRP